MIKPFLLLLTLFAFQQVQATPEVDLQTPLHEEIMAMDRVLFEQGFNHCDLDAVEAILTDDFEFYHDQNGFQDKLAFLLSFEQSLCSNPDRKPIRQPIKDSMHVYPLHNEGVLYGAIQIGTHEFFIREPGVELYKTSIARFNHLWILNGKEWQLKRSQSYDHRAPEPRSDKSSDR
jgi:hypothetical protein